MAGAGPGVRQRGAPAHRPECLDGHPASRSDGRRAPRRCDPGPAGGWRERRRDRPCTGRASAPACPHRRTAKTPARSRPQPHRWAQTTRTGAHSAPRPQPQKESPAGSPKCPGRRGKCSRPSRTSSDSHTGVILGLPQCCISWRGQGGSSRRENRTWWSPAVRQRFVVQPCRR
jgi:hypothetical protein